MPDDKIEISFDDDDKKNSGDSGKSEDTSEERIIIEFGEGEEPERKEEEKEDTPSPEEIIRSSEMDSFYKANPPVNNFYSSGIKFPEGIDSGFREQVMLDVGDSFLNSILENNKYIILTSVSGVIYLIDRFTKKLHKKISCDKESFEKTGLVYKNVLYANSVGAVYKLDEEQLERGIISDPIYRCDAGYFIWSSLNRDGNTICFLEYSPESRKGNIVFFDVTLSKLIFKKSFEVNYSINTLLCIIESTVYFLADNCLYICNIQGNQINRLKPGFEEDEGCFLLGNGNKLYLTSNDGKVYFLDNVTGSFKYTGIQEHYINSVAGFDGNVFTGADDGWKYYNSNGVLVYTHEDVEENRIEAVNKNMLVVSKRNKIVFHNLTRFQEAEGFVIKTEDDTITQDIISSVISFNEIFTLTKQGVLTSITNDKLNIHV